MKKPLLALLLAALILSPFSLDIENYFQIKESNAFTEITGDEITVDTDWTADNGPYHVLDKFLRVNSGVRLTIHPGTVVKLGQASLDIRGELRLEGNAENPVIITSVNDNVAGGETYEFSTGLPEAGDWGSIRVNTGATTTFSYAEIRYAGIERVELVKNKAIIKKNQALAQAIEYETAGLNLSGKADITNSIFSNNKIGIIGAGNCQISISDSEIFNNELAGLISYHEPEITPNTIINAMNNWWGHESGPYHENLNPGGQGDIIEGEGVLFEPWLGSGAEEAPSGFFSGTVSNLETGEIIPFFEAKMEFNPFDICSFEGDCEYEFTLPFGPPGQFSSTTILCDYEFTLRVNSPGFDEYTANNLIIPCGGELTHNPALFPGMIFPPEEPGESIDPLILQYEPILYLHPDENYRPMNVEAFVNNSSLWDANGSSEDILLKAESASDPVALSDLINKEESPDWYLQFSPDLAGTLGKAPDPAKARFEYQALVDSGEAKTTYYAHKMFDSYEDDFGVEHEFIVLQYWFFYAFNDWKEHGGFNNHEGDWEVVMVFLDAETEEPKHVAYSSHHNKGTIAIPVLEYDSVRRNWGNPEIEKIGDQLVSFVALGSHANYPNMVAGGSYSVLPFNDDLMSDAGDHLSSSGWENVVQISTGTDPWLENYEGKWGVDNEYDIADNSSGPQGPFFRGRDMFERPVIWAGIDSFQEYVLVEPLTNIEFSSPEVFFQFTDPLPVGTKIQVDRQDDLAGLWTNQEHYVFLPHVWDINLSLEEGSFEAETMLKYKPEEFDFSPENLTVFHVNESGQIIESMPSSINLIKNEITFTTNHYSRFVIGAYRWQVLDFAHKTYPGLYNPKTGTKKEYVRLKNESDKPISGPFRLYIKDLSEGVEWQNFTAANSEEAYLEIDKLGRKCEFTGEINNLPSLAKWFVRKHEEKDRLLPRWACELATKKFPELAENFEYVWAPGQYSEAIELEFRISDKKVIETRRGRVIHVPENLNIFYELTMKQEVY